MIEFRVDRAAGVPAYLQLIQQVREALRLGWLNAGDKLPTVRDAVASSGINANTVLKAYRELEFAGLAEVRQGSGTYVTDALEAIDSGVMAELRESLTDWVLRGRAAGLGDEDLEALLRAVLNEEGVQS